MTVIKQHHLQSSGTMKQFLLLSYFIVLFFSANSLAQESVSYQVNEMFFGTDAYGQFAQSEGKYTQYGIKQTVTEDDFIGVNSWSDFYVSAYDQGNLRYIQDTLGYTITNSSPLKYDTGEPLDYMNTYHRVWQVHRVEIASHIQDYVDNGQIDQDIPYSILSWPAKGNPNFQNLYGINPDHDDLAPFLDQNNDGIYNPNDGDHPILDENYPQVIPDMMTFAVFNDHGQNHSLGLEFHEMTFAFQCDSLDEINQTIFTKKVIINKSGKQFTDFTYGHLHDIDLGCPEDDFVGVSPELNTIYGYNEDEIDGEVDSSCNVGGLIPTLGNNPGVVATTQLSKDLDAAIAVPRNGQGFPYIDYTSPEVRHKLMHGILCWYRNPDSIIIDTIGFSFTDFPTVTGGNHMANGLQSYDIWTFPSNILPEFNDGDQITLFRAHYYNADPQLNNLEEATNLQNTIPLIQDFFDSGFSTPCQAPITTPCYDDCVWPGDANADGVVLVDDFLPIQYGRINSSDGSERQFVSDYWAGFGAEEWPESYNQNTINLKHADCYGDGTIDNSDLYITSSNYRETHFNSSEPALVESQVSAENIRMAFPRTHIIDQDPLFLRIFASSRIILNFDESEDILGISFSIKIDTSIIKLEITSDDDILFFDYSNAILGFKNFGDEQRGDFFLATNTSTPIEGNYEIPMNFKLFINPNLHVPDGQDSLYIPFPVYNFRAMNMDGDYIDMGVKADSIWLIRDFSSVNDQQKPIDVSIYPNPASSHLTIKSSSPLIGMRMYSTEGKLVQQIEIPNGSWDFNMSTDQLPAGMYIAVLEHDSGITHKKIIIARN